MNLKEWAVSRGIAYVTARRQYAAGKLPIPTYWVGRLIMVGDPLGAARQAASEVVVYARVSSADQRGDLGRQMARVAAWTTGQKLAVSRVVTEIGSAVYGHREKFLALLRDLQVSTIVVEHWDTFARFGAASTSRRLWPRRGEGCSSSTRPRSTTTGSQT